MPRLYFNNKKSLSLIELIIAIAVSAVMGTVVVFTLKTGLEAYHFVQDDVIIQKVIDESLRIASDGDFKSYGIKDSLEILRASNKSVTFVVPWVDEAHQASGEPHEEFRLSRVFQAGASLPIAEIFTGDGKGGAWRQVAATFFLDDKRESANDRVVLNKTLRPSTRVRFIYRPASLNCADCAMTFDIQDRQLMRRYRGRSDMIPAHDISRVILKEANFYYYDNANDPLESDRITGEIPENLLSGITAVKLKVTGQLGDKIKEGSVFINLRNTRSIGSGLIIRKGMQLRIPNSKTVRAFSLLNVMGVKEGGFIRLLVRSDKGQSWQINIELGKKDRTEMIQRYSVDYPAGHNIFSEKAQLPTDIPLNFLIIGSNGRYDYDFDQGMNNVVNLEGQVTLTVLQMDAAGAAIFVRP